MQKMKKMETKPSKKVKRGHEKPEKMEKYNRMWRERLSANVQRRVQISVRQVANHKCNLPNMDSVIVEAISSGFLVRLRRAYLQFITVDPQNKRARQLLRSTDEIVQEQRRHIYNYYMIVHPCSKARLYWEYLMTPVLIMYLVVLPYLLHQRRTFLVETFKLAIDIALLFDVVMTCFTGYVEQSTQKVVLEFRMIIWRYFKTFMLIDLVSALPLNFILVYMQGYAAIYAILPMYPKLLRMPLMIDYMMTFVEMWNISKYYAKMGKYFIYLLVGNIWVTFIITKMNLQQQGDDFSNALYWSTKVFMLAGQINPTDKALHIIIVTLVCLIIGAILNILFVASIMEIYIKYTDRMRNYETVTGQLAEYLNYLKLPHNLRAKLHEYVKFKYVKYIFHEEEILKTLSPKLREEIKRHSCQKLIQDVSIFSELPDTLQLRIMQRMRSTVCLPNDVILQCGISANAMFFIASGSVAVYSQIGKELCHYYDGEHFGEIALVLNEANLVTVIALHTCELYKLTRKDLMEALEPFPELVKEIKKKALKELELKMHNDKPKDDATEPTNEV